MKWAKAQGYRSDNPASDLREVLPQRPKIAAHQRAIAYSEVAAVLRAVREGASTTPSTRRAFEFLVLTAARSGEVRHAQWSEMDWEGRTWTIPAERMKAAREHRVPLSDRALRVLEEAKALTDGDGLIFPGTRGRRPISDMTFSALLRRLRVDAVPHGFRSSFRDWAAELTDAPHVVMEAALAHTVANATEAAYARSDLFDRRRRLMQQWADYLSEAKGVIIPMVRRSA